MELKSKPHYCKMCGRKIPQGEICRNCYDELKAEYEAYLWD